VSGPRQRLKLEMVVVVGLGLIGVWSVCVYDCDWVMERFMSLEHNKVLTERVIKVI